MVSVSFWRYPDPDPYRLKRIRPIDTEPDPKHCVKQPWEIRCTHFSSMT